MLIVCSGCPHMYVPSDRTSCYLTSNKLKCLPTPSHTQTVKPRSRSWKDTVAPARSGGASASIWSRGYTPGCTSTTSQVKKAEEEEEEEEEERPRPPSTRGQERVVGLQGLRLPSRQPGVKRPREGQSSLHLLPLGCCSVSLSRDETFMSGSVCVHVVF